MIHYYNIFDYKMILHHSSTGMTIRDIVVPIHSYTVVNNPRKNNNNYNKTCFYFKMSWIESDEAWGVAAIPAFFAIVISMYNIIKHNLHYNFPEEQVLITKILFTIPLYSSISWMSLKFSENSIYFDIIEDFYDSFIIYCFLKLMFDYVGGQKNCLKLIKNKPPITRPIPLCCLPKVILDHGFLKRVKISFWQFIIINTIMSIISFGTSFNNIYYRKEYKVELRFCVCFYIYKPKYIKIYISVYIYIYMCIDGIDCHS